MHPSENPNVIAGQGTVALESGLLRGGDLSVAAAARLENNAGVAQVGTIQNQGTIQGSVQALGPVANTATGEFRLSSGQSFLATNLGSHENAGLIDAIEASVEFDGLLTNSPGTGRIYGRDSILRFDGGISNQGSVQLSF